MLPKERITFLREHNMCSGIENLLRTALFVKEPEAVFKLQRKQFPNYKNTEKSFPGKEKRVIVPFVVWYNLSYYFCV